MDNSAHYQQLVGLSTKPHDEPLESEEIRFLLDSLKSPDARIFSYAAVLICQYDKPLILEAIKLLPDCHLDVQKVFTPLLASLEFYEAYDFLLNQLKTTRDEAYEKLLIRCLAKTEYFYLPLMFLKLADPDREFLSRLKRVLSLMGWAKLKPYLELLPEIPFEAELRDVFGDDVIIGLKYRIRGSYN